MTCSPQDISKEAIASLKAALTDVTLVQGEGLALRVVTVSSPHVTGCATAREPGEGIEGGGGRKTSACSFALDVKGAWKATSCSSKNDDDKNNEIDGSYHVARIVNDPEFESGIGPLNVEMASDVARSADAEAALERARAEIAERVVEAVKSTLASVSSSSPPPKAATEQKNVEGEKKGEAGAKAAGEAA